MRPHHLRVQAFGPFADVVELDLDALSEAGLFLLHGETGAGKTSLLDAVVWALYGAVPGARATVGRLRSDHAAPSLRTEVGLEVTLGGRRLRVTRWPAHERPKRRGAGTTSDPAGARLEELRDGVWTALSTRVDEVGAELSDLLGMSAVQFFSVVLLPQGEFARFLRAPSEERGELLGRLFATGRFAAVETWLARRRRESADEVERATARLDRLVARVAQAAGEEEPDEAGEPWLAAVRERLAAAVDDAQVAAATAAAAEEVALGAREEAVRRAGLQQRRRTALARAAALHAGAEQAEVLHLRLDRAEAAAPVAPVLAELARAQAAAAQAEQVLAAAAAALPADLRHADGPVLRAAAQEASRLAGVVAPAVAEEDAAVEREEEVVRAREAWHAAVSAASGAAGRRARLPAEVTEAAEALAASRRDAAALPGREAAAEVAAARSQAVARLLPVLADVPRARLAVLEARERHVAAESALVDARRARVDGMAAELAAALEPGTPCAVCGSEVHPDPVEMRPGAVDAAQEDAAEARVQEAAEELRHAREALARVERDAASLRGALQGAGLPDEPSPADALRLDAERDAARRALTAARTGAAREAADEARYAALVAQGDALAAAERAAAEQVATARTTAREREAAQEAASERLQDLRAGYPSVRARQTAQEARAAAATAAREAVGAAERARGELGRLRGAAHEAAAQAGFGDPSDAAAAVLAADELAAVRRARQDRAAEVAAVGALLADPDLDVALDPPADPRAAADAARRAVSASREAAGRAAAAARAQAEVERLAVPVRAALDGLVPLRRAAADVRALADLATGRGANQLAMPLSAFVLSARLEEVAAAASTRLERMTQGRYTLRHTDERLRRGRSGLGLAVADAWTGVQRDAGSLSGGETFLASLALALGLADVVTAEAGGQRLDTLFVDEGFGTLDPDALEEVMDVLDGLREGGRMVGVVSHVAEMRARVPAQVHVVKGRAGSSVRVADGLPAPQRGGAP